MRPPGRMPLIVATAALAWAGPAPIPAPSPCRAQAPPASLPREAVPRLFDPTLLGEPLDGPAAAAARTPSPLDPAAVVLRPVPVGPADLALPINLATALRLSDARPLVVAAAQASVWIAEARLARAKVLWVPTLMIGFDYIRHDGGGPDFNKGILTAPSVNFFYGGGSLIQVVNVSDVVFEPRIARRELDARHWDVQRAKNDALLETARAYFEVHRSRGTLAGSLYAVERGRDLVERVEDLSAELVPRVEVERARNLLAELQQRATRERQDWRVGSANLTQVLRLDPRVVVVPLEEDHLQVTLVDPGRSLDQLMPIALSNRPELWSSRATVSAAESRVRREKLRPALPIVMLNGFQSAGMLLQAGIFGMGPNDSLDQWTGRSDVSIQMLWQLEGFGVGNLARIKEQRGDQSRAIIDLRKAQDEVAADVTRARARLQAAAARVLQADRSLRSAIIAFEGSYEGLRETTRFGDVLMLVNRPQEAVFALFLMKIAFDNYFATVAEYNVASFELFHALGYPARELSALRPVGDPVPVDTRRPAFLPPVGHGPPPATR